jgi:hypothetical protein
MASLLGSPVSAPIEKWQAPPQSATRFVISLDTAGLLAIMEREQALVDFLSELEENVMSRTALCLLVLCVFLVVPLVTQAECLPSCDDIDNLVHCQAACQSYMALSYCANISGPIGCPNCRIVYTCRGYWVLPSDPTPVGVSFAEEEQLSSTVATGGTFLVYRYCG